jgi:hypothetical protein
VGDRSRGRFAKPADFLDTMVPRTGGYTYGVGGLGFVPRPRTIFCRAVLNPLRFATFPSLYHVPCVCSASHLHQLRRMCVGAAEGGGRRGCSVKSGRGLVQRRRVQPSSLA